MEIVLKPLWNPKRQLTEVNIYIWKDARLLHSAVGATALQLENLADARVCMTGLVLQSGFMLLDEIVFTEKTTVQKAVSFPTGTFKYLSGLSTVEVRFEEV